MKLEGGVWAGLSAIQFFEATNPNVPRYGRQGAADNQAEWIVDLTTKVRACQWTALSKEHTH